MERACNVRERQPIFVARLCRPRTTREAGQLKLTNMLDKISINLCKENLLVCQLSIVIIMAVVFKPLFAEQSCTSKFLWRIWPQNLMEVGPVRSFVTSFELDLSVPS